MELALWFLVGFVSVFIALLKDSNTSIKKIDFIGMMLFALGALLLSFTGIIPTLYLVLKYYPNGDDK